MRTTRELSAISEAGTAYRLALGPTIAVTSFWVMSFCAAEADWSAFPALSSM